MSREWNGWTEEPPCERLAGWHLVAAWAAAWLLGCSIMGAFAYGLMKLAGVL